MDSSLQDRVGSTTFLTQPAGALFGFTFPELSSALVGRQTKADSLVPAQGPLDPCVVKLRRAVHDIHLASRLLCDWKHKLLG